MLLHSFVSLKPDAADATKLRPSDWNAEHVFSGGNSGAILIRDTTDPTGADWINSVAVGAMLVSGGVGTAPTWGSPYIWNTGASPANNTLIGLQTGVSITSGFSITAIGSYAGENTTTGASCTFVGTRAGESNTSGNFNTYMGSFSGEFATGSANAYYGYKSGFGATSGDRDTYLGDSAGITATTGSDNVCVGQHSGQVLTTGSQNTAIGASTVFSAAGATGQTVIGYGATAVGNNSVTLGRNTDTVYAPNLLVANSASITTFLAVTSSPALSGWLRGPNNQQFKIRNAANSADLNMILLDSNNVLYIGDTQVETVIQGAGPLSLKSNLVAPGVLVDGMTWFEFTGTTPTRQLRVAVRDGGVTYYQNIGAAH